MKNELNIMVEDIKPYIIGITESWANNDITDAELRRFALRFFHSHSGATGVFCLICRTAYFRCAANLI